MPPPTREQARILAAGCSSFVLLGMAVASSGPMGVALHERFGQPETSSPHVSLAFFIGSAVVILAAALTQGLFTRVWVPRIATVIYLVGAVLAFTAGQWSLVLAGSFLMGCANGGHGTWFNGEVARQMRGPWLAVLNGCWAIGAIIGPLLLRQNIQSPLTAFGVMAVASLLVVPLMALLPRHSAEPDEEDHSATQMPNGVYLLAVLMALYVGIETTVFVFYTQFLMEIQKLGMRGATEVGSTMMLAFAVGRFALGAVSTRLSARRGVVLCGVLAALGGGLALVPGQAVAGLLVLGLAMGPVFPTLVAWVGEITRNAHRGTAILTTGGVLAAALAPAISGWIVIPRPGVLPMLVVAAFGGMAVLAWGSRLHKAATENA